MAPSNVGAIPIQNDRRNYIWSRICTVSCADDFEFIWSRMNGALFRLGDSKSDLPSVPANLAVWKSRI
jgi:hypothetical protein